MDTITSISIKDLFWMKFSDHLVSFGYIGLPKDVHFTISFDEKSNDINLHVTRNVANPKDKPYIKLVLMGKELFKEERDFSLWMLNKMLVPFDMDELKKKHGDDLYYLPYKDTKHGSFQSIASKRMIENFNKISKIKKKTRLKITGDIEKEINDLLSSDELIEAMLDSIVELPEKYDTPVDGGIIMASEDNPEPINVIRIYDKWYTVRSNMSLEELLSHVLNSKLAKKLLWKTRRSIIIVKNANSSADTKEFNKPIRLVRVKKLPPPVTV